MPVSQLKSRASMRNVVQRTVILYSPMLDLPRTQFHVAADYQPLMRELGIDAAQIFRHPQIKVWRSIPDRENCTLDAQLRGQPIRLHIKRYVPAQGFTTPADDEVRA